MITAKYGKQNHPFLYSTIFSHPSFLFSENASIFLSSLTKMVLSPHISHFPSLSFGFLVGPKKLRTTKRKGSYEIHVLYTRCCFANSQRNFECFIFPVTSILLSLFLHFQGIESCIWMCRISHLPASNNYWRVMMGR